jgi:hypothetical protein
MDERYHADVFLSLFSGEGEVVSGSVGSGSAFFTRSPSVVVVLVRHAWMHACFMYTT